ncbi:MAG: hypothetical protein AAF500_04100 [Myxococcota bacterium]
MSGTTGIALIIASVFPAIFIYTYLSKLAEDCGAMVVTGVVHGARVPMKYRWVMLNQTYTGYVLGAIVVGMFLLFIGLRIGALVDDGGVRGLAYAAAAAGGTSAIAWMIYGISEFLLFRSLLKELEAKGPAGTGDS